MAWQSFFLAGWGSIVGRLAATEGADSFTAQGTIETAQPVFFSLQRLKPIAGKLRATEATDSCEITGTVSIPRHLAPAFEGLAAAEHFQRSADFDDFDDFDRAEVFFHTRGNQT